MRSNIIIVIFTKCNPRISYYRFALYHKCDDNIMRNAGNNSATSRVNHKYSMHQHQPVENGRLKLVLEMCATTFCHITMESFGIIEKSKQSIVSDVTRFIENSLIEDNKCTTSKNQLLNCDQDCLRGCGCHGCGGYLCLQQRRYMRTRRGGKGVPVC